MNHSTVEIMFLCVYSPEDQLWTLDISELVLLQSSVITRRHPYKPRVSLVFRVYDSRHSETFLSSLAGKYRFCPKINTEFCITVDCTGIM